MNKFIYLIAILLFISCSEDNIVSDSKSLESTLINDSIDNEISDINPLSDEEIEEMKLLKESMIKTRYLSDDNDYKKELESLIGIPVYLKVKESNFGKNYLTTYGAGKEVKYDNFKGNNTQQFYIGGGYSSASGIDYLIYSYKEKKPLSIGSYSSNPEKKVIYILSSANLSYGCSWDFYPGTSSDESFVIENTDVLGKGSTVWNSFYYAIGAVDNNVTLGKYLNKKNQEFEISPVEEFYVKEVKYIEDNTSSVLRKPDKVLKTYYTNDGPVQQTKNLTLSEELTETSNFSHKTGISISIKTEFKTGVPIFASGKIETSTTSSYEYSYGKSSSKRQSVSHTFPLVVPARSYAECTLSFAQYEANVKYEAICIGKTSGREIKIRGQWDGISFSEDRTNVKITSLDNPSIVKSASFKGVPKNTVIIQ